MHLYPSYYRGSGGKVTGGQEFQDIMGCTVTPFLFKLTHTYVPAYFLSTVNDKVTTESRKLIELRSLLCILGFKKKIHLTLPSLVSMTETGPVWRKTSKSSADYRKFSQPHFIFPNSSWSRPQIWRRKRVWNRFLSFVKTHACPSLISFRFCLSHKNKT